MLQFEETLELLCFPKEKQCMLQEFFERKSPYFFNQAKIAYEGAPKDFPICKRTPLERLVIWCCIIPGVIQKYEAAGVSKSIIRDTLLEVKHLSEKYREKTGKEGLSKDNVIWLRHICCGQLFQIGSLQFQMFRMCYLDKEGCGQAYMDFSPDEKKRLPPGSPVINLHIPSGADLSVAAVESSICRAKDFFAVHYPEFSGKTFVCYSWLLYPGMLELLPPGSRIGTFASRFRVIGAVSDPYGSDAVNRIYGRRYRRKSDYPQNTQLQRSALGNFSKLGMGCGVIEFT